MAFKSAADAIFPAGCAALLMLSGCAEPSPDPRVRDIEAVAGQTFADPSTLTFTITGGEKDVRLNNVFSTMAIEARFLDENGDPVPLSGGINIPARETVRFTTDGAHVELIEVNRIARGMEKIEVSFVFSDGSRLFANAPFRTPEGAQSL